LSGVRSEVKATTLRARPRGLSRHFEGWQPGLIAVLIAALGALLAIPHPVAPNALPLPKVSWAEAERVARLDRTRADAAYLHPLPYDVRAVGETLRAFGAATVANDVDTAAQKLRDLRRFTHDAREKLGDDPLLELMSTQTELFLSALRRYEAGSDESREIAELGGNYLEKARAAGWIGADRHFLASEVERRTAFRLRWVDLVGLRQSEAFKPTANEWRIYYRFLLQHPEAGLGARELAAEEQIRYVAPIEKVDPDYPAAFAMGVLYYRLGYFQKSAQAFRGHLARSANGPWRLRARNHLLAAAERAKETSGEL
jgi:hypothetical protein